MSTSILLLNKSNTITSRNNKNNSDCDRDSGSDNNGVNKGYNVKMTLIQDEPNMLVNYEIILPYTLPGLRSDNQLVPTSLYIKK